MKKIPAFSPVFTRLIACAVTTGLILTAPGLGSYDALAQTIGVGVQPVAAPAGGGYAVGSALNTQVGNVSGAPTLSLGSVDLLSTGLPAIAAPRVTKTPASRSLGMVPMAGQTVGLAAPAEIAALRAVPSLIHRQGVVEKTQPARAGPTLSRGSKSAALTGVKKAVGEVRSGRVRPFAVLSRFFDRTGKRGGLSAVAPVAGRMAAPGRSLLLKPGAASSPEGSRARAPQERRGARGTAADAKQTQGQISLWRIFTMAAVAAAGAYFGAPYLVGLAGASLPAWFAANPVWTRVLITGAGWLTGVAASQFDLWKGWPSAVWGTAKKAAVTTFRFWARFGRIFNAVLTGGSSDDAMKAPLPINIFKYPVLAWPFVLIGYGTVPALAAAALYFGMPLGWLALGAALVFGGAPMSFAIGAIYQLVATPVHALLRGLKRVIVGFFPWIQNVLDFLGRVIRKAIPFILGFLWGGIRAGGIGIGVGFMHFARPTFENVVAAEYKVYDSYEGMKLKDFPGVVAMRLLQFVGLIASGVLGIVGGALGLILSLPYMFTHALDTALEKSGIEGKTAQLLRAWRDSLEDEIGLGDLSDYGFQGPKDADEIGLGNGLVRMLNTAAHAGYMIPTLTVLAVVAYVRSWVRAVKKVRDGEEYDKGAEPRLDPVKDEPDQPEKPPVSKTGFLLPFTLAVLGLGIGAAVAYFYFFPGVEVGALVSVSALLKIGGAGLIGAVLGLAASQPKAWKGYLPAMWSMAKEASRISFRGWARLGVNTDAALRDVHKDPKLYRDTPGSVLKYPWLARAAVVAGYVGAVVAFPVGLAYRAAAVPIQAAWLGFINMMERFFPFLKRVLRAVWRVLKEAIPFAAGLVWGTIKGLGLSIFAGAALLAKPMFERAVDPKDAEYEFKTLPQAFGVRIVQGISIIFGLVAGILGAVMGLVYGLPFTLTMALSQAFRWADVGGRSESFFRIWEKETLRNEMDELEAYTELGFPTQGKKITYWDGFVRAGNLLTFAVFSLASNVLVAAAAYIRSVFKAARLALRRDPDKSRWEVEQELAEKLRGVPGFVEVTSGYKRGSIMIYFKTKADIEAALKAGQVARRMEGYRIELMAEDTGKPYFETSASQASGSFGKSWDRKPPEGRKASRGEAIAALVLGLVGLAGGLYAAYAYVMPLLGLGGWMLYAGYAASGIIGSGLGLAISQPSAWKGAPMFVLMTSIMSGAAAIGFWAEGGIKYAEAVGRRNPLAYMLVLPFVLIGAVLFQVWKVLGLAYALVAVPASAALQGAWRILENIWPWIRSVAEVLWKVAKRFFPFVFGGIAGLLVGSVGTAVFGAMLLGRPWFKYVVAQDTDAGTIGKFIGTALIKLLASVVGVVFGAIGLVVGALAAIPYILTFGLALAFQFADVGGRVEKFFDHWNKGTLINELRRINLLTNKFEFDDVRNGEISPTAALIRMANIFPATLAAAFAATIAGYISYFRSMWRAWRNLRDGKDVPEDPFYDDPGDVAWRAARKGSRHTRKWMGRLLGFGGMLGGAALIIRSFWVGGFLSALWKGFLLGILSWPAGWLGGLILGAVIGFAVGLMVWLAKELDRKAPEAKNAR